MMTLSDPNSNHKSNILLVNAYFPSDYGTPDSHNNFLDTIVELEGFIASHEYDNLILCGDFNVDFFAGLDITLIILGPLCVIKTLLVLISAQTLNTRTGVMMVEPSPGQIMFSLLHHAHSISDVSTLESVDNF